MKQATLLYSILIFILCSAMSCDEDLDYNYETIKCNLTDIELHHINNEGETPQIAEYKVKKEAYMLGIELITDKEEPFFPPSNPIYDFKLNNGITKIRIFIENALSGSTLDEKDISTNFQDYPIRLPYQIKDCTLSGDTLYDVSNNRIYKALTTYPDAGIYAFKVIISLSDGTLFETKTSFIELY